MSRRFGYGLHRGEPVVKGQDGSHCAGVVTVLIVCEASAGRTQHNDVTHCKQVEVPEVGQYHQFADAIAGNDVANEVKLHIGLRTGAWQQSWVGST